MKKANGTSRIKYYAGKVWDFCGQIRIGDFDLMSIKTVMMMILWAALAGQLFAAEGKSNAKAGSIYFPSPNGPWERVKPNDKDWDLQRLEEAIEFAGERKSSGVVVLYRGRILIERYWDLKPEAKLPNGRLNRYYYMVHGKDSDGHVIEDVASAQKSVVSILTGIAQHKGLLKISEPVHKYLGQGWSKAPRDAEARITLRHLLTMTSGLNDQLEYEAPAGTRWRYNTSAYSQILLAVSTAAQMEPNELTRKWLTGPIGMNNSRWIERSRAINRQVTNKFGFATTARDLARFALLVLAGGVWDDRAVIEDKKYLRAALEPSQELNPSYGYLWWLNGQPFVLRGNGERRFKGPLIPGAPDDLVVAVGALGRKAYIVPSRELVVIRLGDAPEIANKPSFDEEFWRRIMASYVKN